MEGGGSNEELTLNLPFGISPAAGGGRPLARSPTASALLPNTECPGGINQACYEGGVRTRIFDQNFRPAMINQWNLTFQQLLTNTLTFQLGYVGQTRHPPAEFRRRCAVHPVGRERQSCRTGDPIVTRVPGPFLGGGYARIAVSGGQSPIQRAELRNPRQSSCFGGRNPRRNQHVEL